MLRSNFRLKIHKVLHTESKWSCSWINTYKS